MITILVIDDEQSLRDLLETVFRRKGYQVLLADNGRRGIDVFKKERPFITVLDLRLPDMEGIAVLKELRAIDPRSSVIILTGGGMVESERQARELGVREFLAKGFSLHTLGAALDRVLKGEDYSAIATHSESARCS